MPKRKTILAICILFVIILLTCEIVLRVLGYKAYQQMDVPFTDCGRSFIKADPYLGFSYRPGHFNCAVNGLPFTLTQEADSSRATSNSPTCDSPVIYLHGCSLTWGHGLCDSATMGWKLQHLISHGCVKNFGIGAGSNVQSYLLLKRSILDHQIPDIVVLNYTTYHHTRNCLTWPWRRLWMTILAHERPTDNSWNNITIPYARINNNDQLEIRYMTESELQRGVPFKEYSVVFNLLNEAYQKFRDRDVNETIITESIIKEMAALCAEHHIRFIVTEIIKDKLADRVISDLKDRDIEVGDISVDITNNKYNLKPYDGHPNEKANDIYAQKLLQILNRAPN